MQTLLLVDDEPNIVEGLASQFEGRYGGDVIVLKSFSGLHALSILQNNKVDVVLSDIRMPDMDGLDILPSLRSWSSLPGPRSQKTIIASGISACCFGSSSPFPAATCSRGRWYREGSTMRTRTRSIMSRARSVLNSSPPQLYSKTVSFAMTVPPSGPAGAGRSGSGSFPILPHAGSSWDACHTPASACSRSAMMSFTSSMPTEKRTRSGATPAAASSSSFIWRWVEEAGWRTQVLASAT